MTSIYFTCTLKSDIIVNASMATTDNVSSLDYIPGSVFLGIVAKELYKRNDKAKENYDIFHSGKVKFGNALITDGETISYSYPFSLYKDKLEGKEEYTRYIHHLLDEGNYPKKDDFKIQLKQVRTDYFTLKDTTDKDATEIRELKVEKNFAIKSARDSETRRSKDKQMFGYQSIKAGQTFVFCVTFEDDTYKDDVVKALAGTRRVGKSRTAEYSLVEIKQIELDNPHEFSNETATFCLVYAQSNLCFLDENGQPNLQPKAKDLGFENGEINWEKSQIRTYNYTSWNAKRHTPNAQRFCIAKGSVFYLENTGNTVTGEQFVGEYQALL